MGNICRSPTAQGVMRKILAEHGGDLSVELDSAGTHAYHVGDPPDRRSREAARRRGIDISDLAARVVEPADFETQDYILAMDELNLVTLQDMSPARPHAKLRLMTDFVDDPSVTNVPDPYYGGSAGFEQVLDLLEQAGLGLLRKLEQAAQKR